MLADNNSNQDRLEAAVMRLEKASRFFYDNGSYEGEKEPALFEDLVALLESDDPLSRFEAVLEHGTLAGKLYALCGIYFCSQERFDLEISRLKKSPIKGEVTTIEGDLGWNEPFQDLLDGSNRNAVRLRYGETIAEFVSRTGHFGPIDMKRGGIPVQLLDEGAQLQKGLYSIVPGSPEPHPDPEITNLVIE